METIVENSALVRMPAAAMAMIRVVRVSGFIGGVGALNGDGHRQTRQPGVKRR